MTRTVGLAGNPNVGKSTIFNQLTGSHVDTAHYGGTTVGLNVAMTSADDCEVRLLDLPGLYSFGERDDSEIVAREGLLEERPDAVLAVVDAANLARNLPLVFELADTGVPVAVALNLVDEAARHGLEVDVESLSAALGIPVVSTIGVGGVGVAEAFTAALAEAGEWRDGPARYDEQVEEALAEVSSATAKMPKRPYGLPPRALAIQLVEGRQDMLSAASDLEGGREAIAAALLVRDRVGTTRRAIAARLARERHAIARRIARDVTHTRAPAARWTLASVTTSPVTGVPILLAVLASVFGVLFVLGGALASGFEALWARFAAPPFEALVARVAGDGVVAETLLWGFAGVEASLSVGLPYILTFYVMLALLEDSGYLASVAFLADRVMHRFGLHGRAVIPMVAAAGCNVPAVLATRSLGRGRERTIATTLVVMVPCSARSAVILGAAGRYLGWAPAAAVFAVVAALTFGIGIALDRWLPGRAEGLVMEVFPFRRPAWKPVVRRAWDRFGEFLLVATPIVVIGSVFLGGLYETGWLWTLTRPLDPIVVGWLGLPAVAGLTLLLGLLRKELALQLLVTLAVVSYGSSATNLRSFMSAGDVFVYALVNTIAVPCISTVTVLARELGPRRATLVVSLTIVLALIVGGVFAQAFAAIGW